jgi:hypothetical protein
MTNVGPLLPTKYEDERFVRVTTGIVPSPLIDRQISVIGIRGETTVLSVALAVVPLFPNDDLKVWKIGAPGVPGYIVAEGILGALDSPWAYAVTVYVYADPVVVPVNTKADNVVDPVTAFP